MEPVPMVEASAVESAWKEERPFLLWFGGLREPMVAPNHIFQPKTGKNPEPME